MKAKLIAIFEEMGFPYWLMHTMPASKKYPDSFFTFLTTDTRTKRHYDNRPRAVVWVFMIGFYSNDPALVESVPRELINRLQAQGWTVPGVGEDVPTDEPTHTGWLITAYYVQNIDKEAET